MWCWAWAQQPFGQSAGQLRRSTVDAAAPLREGRKAQADRARTSRSLSRVFAVVRCLIGSKKSSQRPWTFTFCRRRSLAGTWAVNEWMTYRASAEGASIMRVEWSERHEALNRNGRATWPTRFSAEIASEICSAGAGCVQRAEHISLQLPVQPRRFDAAARRVLIDFRERGPLARTGLGRQLRHQPGVPADFTGVESAFFPGGLPASPVRLSFDFGDLSGDRGSLCLRPSRR
jgi:hypothetical protein